MIPYIIKVMCCSALFLLTYKVLLEKEKMLRFNRFYLLSGLILPFIIPVITFSAYTPVLPTVEHALAYAQMAPGSGSAEPLKAAGSANQSFSLLQAVYITVTLFLLIRFITNLAAILYKTRNNSIIPYHGAKIILITGDLTPHSFLNYIFISNEDYRNGRIGHEILTHELSHVRQRHAYDMLFTELLQAVFWLNPFITSYKKAIQLNHEFLADEAVINMYPDITGYQYLLISHASKPASAALTSRFNYAITKKRLIMMTKTTSSAKSLCRKIAVVPVLAVSIFLFSTPIAAQDSLPVPKAKHTEVPSTQEGVSQAQLDEFNQLLNITENEKSFPTFNKISDADRNRLETIFLSMSKDQQAKQSVVLMPAPPPLPRVIPTTKQIESWKNSHIYGLWINDKRVSNAVLNDYKNTDFAQVFVSKLGKNTVNYGKHYYQVNLMTTGNYNEYYKKTIESKNKYFMFLKKWQKPQPES